MLDAAMDAEQPPSTRLERLLDLGKQAGELLASRWHTDPEVTIPALRTGKVHASLPSLAAIAVGRPHSKATARAVARNLRGYYRDIMSSELTNPCEMRDREDSDKIRGQFSELGVYGVLWWGITSGQRHRRSAILPTKKEDDRGAWVNGYRTGCDYMILNEEGTVEYVEVKTSDRSRRARKEISSYRPGIAVIKPMDLIDEEPEAAGLMLMDALVGNDCGALRRANDRAQELIAAAALRGAAFQTVESTASYAA
jgi:hypothetical protein